MTDARERQVDALIDHLQREQGGRLTIFLGAAPGVGKTYTMLSRARELRRQGRDVVVGIVETHGRGETAALTEGLEILPRRRIAYQGRWLEEMDLDALLARRPQIALVKTRWRKKGARSVEERAGVIGANVWKIAVEIFRHMEKEGFRFGSDRMTTEVIAESIAFLVQLADRAVYGRLAEEERAALIGAVVRHLAATMENNQQDLFGPGEYRKPFIDALNARFGEYAELEYRDGEPGYACLRFFASRVAEVMAEGDNRWVIEQMMDVEAPEMVRLAKKLVEQTIS